MEVVEDAVASLNGEGYDDFFATEFNVEPENHHGEIEIESYAPRVFIPSKNPPHGEQGVKKRRIEWVTYDEDDGDVDDISITGLEAERSDVAPITQTAQEAFADTIRMSDSEARSEVFGQLREWAQAIKQGCMSLNRVCKRGGLGQPLAEYGTATRRPAPLYRGAKYANENVDGVTIQRGDKPRVVYITGVRGDYSSTYSAVTGEDGDRVDAVSLPDADGLPEGFVVDWERHWVKALREPMRPLLETRGWSWSEILEGHEQTGLSSFEAGT